MSSTTLKKKLSADDHFLGDLIAPVKIVEYGDFQCPYCQDMATKLNELVQKNYNEVCFAFRQFPLTGIHENAAVASVASEAAGIQGKFWEMHTSMFTNQHDLSIGNIVELAKELKLDTKRFVKDLDSIALSDKVQKDFLGGVESGVTGTPTLFVNGIRYKGELNIEALLLFVHDLKGAMRFSV
jgi:protein-disulfide isomerase